MFWRRTMAKQEVTVKFGGDIEEVDIDTFAHVLLDYSTVISEAGAMADPSLRINTNIRATRQGCLEAVLSVANGVIGSLLADPAAASTFLLNTISIAKDSYKLIQFLAGHGGCLKEVQTIGDGCVKVIASDNATININIDSVNLYKDSPRTHRAITNTFSTLAEVGDIEELQISSPTSDIETLSVPKDLFANIANVPMYESVDVKHETIDAILTVIKPALTTGHRKWEFIWLGNKMSAYITDCEFLQGLSKQKYNFTLGTTMNVSLDLIQKYDPKKKAFLNIDYNVVKVNAVYPPVLDEPLF